MTARLLIARWIPRTILDIVSSDAIGHEATPPARDPPPRAGATGSAATVLHTLDRYEVESTLDGGTGATVVAARQRISGRPVVLKSARGDSSAWAEFEAGAARLKALNHPGIPELLAIEHGADGRPVAVMARAPGRPLTAWIRDLRLAPERAGALTEIGSRIEVLIAVCQAVAAGHAAGLLHLDVTPANVVTDGMGAVNVVDWDGAQRLAVGDGWRTPVTPIYLAPEQARGEGVDERTDVYGIAATGLHLLVLRLPTWSDDVEALMRRKREGRIDEWTPSERAALPRSLRATIDRALAVDPARRPHSPLILADELRRAADSRITLTGRLRRWLAGDDKASS